MPKADEARVEVRLARSSPVRLRVLDARGNPAKYVGVSIADGQGAGPAWRFVYARPHGTAFVISEGTVYAATPPHDFSLIEGEGRIEGLPAGKYVLRAKEGTIERVVPFEVTGGKDSELEVRLGP